ncbi:RNA-directed DNA polymerase, eukaryota, reverse transcriptase zinc-binding domain protein [Tanacetum coccineum]
MIGILKKMDRAMSNEEFMKQFPNAHAKLVEEFLEAESDEEKFLFQQAKIMWLSEGDMNTRKDICCAIREFFITGKLLGELNATLVSLIPKVPIPNKVTNFRPISYCNVMYKCISKVITNRIKPVLGCLVSHNQIAFIQERHIQDNIHEIMKGYNRKNGPHRVPF